MSEQELIEINASARELPDPSQMGWQMIRTAPFDRDLELAVIDAQGVHALVFPCRRVLRGWVKAGSSLPVNVHPTHWRHWDDSVSPLLVRPAS